MDSILRFRDGLRIGVRVDLRVEIDRQRTPPQG
jgi:hypothetical protein